MVKIVWLQWEQGKPSFSLITVSLLVFTILLPSREHAAQHIAVLVEADRRGHYSHGFNRLRGHYVADIRFYLVLWQTISYLLVRK